MECASRVVRDSKPVDEADVASEVPNLEGEYLRAVADLDGPEVDLRGGNQELTGCDVQTLASKRNVDCLALASVVLDGQGPSVG